jgi:hypothetical protein
MLGVLNNVTDRRNALMVQIETYLDRHLASRRRLVVDGGTPAALAETVARLESTVARFEASLRAFSDATRDLREVHLVVGLHGGARG